MKILDEYKNSLRIATSKLGVAIADGHVYGRLGERWQVKQMVGHYHRVADILKMEKAKAFKFLDDKGNPIEGFGPLPDASVE